MALMGSGFIRHFDKIFKVYAVILLTIGLVAEFFMFGFSATTFYFAITFIYIFINIGKYKNNPKQNTEIYCLLAFLCLFSFHALQPVFHNVEFTHNKDRLYKTTGIIPQHHDKVSFGRNN
ncbi:hypothetical protein AAHK14_11810 [Moraxella sp. K1664]|uniref:hypothetical protein n=1 Tax=Moraxella sp. K1664 TaxID=2780077 RepID=UPI003216972E